MHMLLLKVPMIFNEPINTFRLISHKINNNKPYDITNFCFSQ